jgi:hypothetical protein
VTKRKEIRKLFDEATNKLPEMIDGLMEMVYYAEAGEGISYF